MIMETTSSDNIAQQQSPAYALMKRGKRGAAALIAADCCNVAAAAATTVTAQQQHPDDNSFDDAGTTESLIRCKLLDSMLDVLLNPYDAIGELNNLDWLQWLMAGGKTLDEFSTAVKYYDYGTCCGLVWTANYVAYRCRTCSISPCMSLCGECFKRGDHTGHDFNMFRSQAGGACDCGDTSVMKPEGFCRKHNNTNNTDGSANNVNCKQPPADLLRVAERIMPRLLLRLVQYLRENSKNADSRTANTQHGPSSSQQQQNLLLLDLDPFLGMLHDLSSLGAAMRRIMTISLTNEKIYRWACDYYSTTSNIIDNNSSLHQQQQTIYTLYTDKVRRYYTEAIHQFTSTSSQSNSDEDIVITNSNLSNSEDDDEDEFDQDNWSADNQNSTQLKNKLNHSSFLQEIVFWTVRYEFPQKMVCLLLNMLPDSAYKEKMTEAFVMHYGCVARVLATTSDSDTLSNHIVHISVQLFSNETLATRMVDKFGLLKVMVSSLRRMMKKILIPSTLHDPTKNKHKVVDCSKAVMKEHCYWPLVSDLNNVLSHRPIAVKFMCDDRLLDSWFSYLSMFQGMNVNCRELGHHVEFEPNTYYAAFSAELEASAYPMWAMLSHLTTADTWHLTSRVLRACLQRLQKWLIDVGYYNQYSNSGTTVSSPTEHNIDNSTSASIRRWDDRHQFTFHLPLHRYLAVFLCQAVRAQGARIEDIIPQNHTGDKDSLFLAIATHPVRAQAAFYEIMQGTWLRNGLQIKGQAMTYIQSNFCISMVDADIYLLQLCLSELSNANIFMSLILEKFKVYDWMRIIKHGGLPQIMDSIEYDVASSMESFLVFLATLVGVRTNLCSNEDYDYCQSQLEMVTLLCVSDKTHSQLMELMPERCGSTQTTHNNSAATNGDNSSQNRSNLDSPRDFETVLKAVAEYKKPQFEASGNMQQGLYVPLAHVWQNLYDPIHVLLRAVHRRDFQSSMDRYTVFMRSMGLLRQNEIPWPPYRTPQKHHQVYRDPRRALLSRLFHGVVWHCLYRTAVYRDINEHTLSLLIYLLDQALICYNNSCDKQQPMDTDQPARTFSSISGECSKHGIDDKNRSRKRHIKITATNIRSDISDDESYTETNQDSTIEILNHWYESDDLIHNLCTTITNVELPPPFYHYYFGTATDDSTTGAAAPTITTNLFDYFTSSAGSLSPTTVSYNETGNARHQQTNIGPSLTEVVGNEVPIATSSRSNQIAPRPPFYSLNAAAAATTSTMDFALNRVKQRLQFLRPPLPKMTPNQQQSTSSLDQQQTTPHSNTATNNLHNFEDITNITEETKLSGKQHQLNEKLVSETNDDDQYNSLVPINESIISLLLKLHSHLSGKPDSYQLPSAIKTTSIDGETTNKFVQESLVSENADLQDKIPACGDGIYYVGRLLDKLTKGSLECYECVVRTKLVLWPKAVVMRETATREDEEHKRLELKRLARFKQQKMMKDMVLAQRAFLENARRSGDLDSTDTELQTQSQTTNVTTNMECDEPVSSVDTSTTTANYGNVSASVLNVTVDENSTNKPNTTKESTTGIHDLRHETTQTVDCVICNQTVVVQMDQQIRDPIGLVILVQGSNVLAHRRHIPLLTMKNQNINTDSNLHQEMEIATTVTNSSLDDIDEPNYYHYWPALPTFQSLHQQSTSVDDQSDVQFHHNQAMVTTPIENNDITTYASHSDRRKRLITQYFNNLDKADLEIGALSTTTNTYPIGGNVHVQTCGHHLHLRCWSSYLASLRGTQRFNSDRGEYSCPLCRQLANSLMPFVGTNQKKHEMTSYITLMTKTDMSNTVNELTELIKQQENVLMKPAQSSNMSGRESSNLIVPGTYYQNIEDERLLLEAVRHNDVGENGLGDNEDKVNNTRNIGDPLLEAINICVNDMITTTVVTSAAQTLTLPTNLLTTGQREKMYKVRWHSVVSVAWTNIQIELVQRNNSLIEQKNQEWPKLNKYAKYYKQDVTDSSGNNNHYNMLPKRNCVAPLLKVLRVSSRSLLTKYQKNNYYPLSDIWYKLIGIKQPEHINTHPPLLMRDPCVVLLQFVLMLPTLKQDMFDTLVKLTFNMQLYATALKVAITWNHNCNHNRHKQCKRTEETYTTDGSSLRIDLDDGSNDMSTVLPMDTVENKNKHSSKPLFSQAVAMAKTIVFLSQENNQINDVEIDGIEDEEFIMHHYDHDNDIVSNNKVDIPIITTEEDKECMFLLESYGRQCTLPFLRFAALLKKYTNEENDPNLDIQIELKTILSSLQQLSNLNMEQLKQSELFDNKEQQSTHNPNINSFKPNVHWSQDDYEFLTLAQYLRLFNYTNDGNEENSKNNFGDNNCENKTKQNAQLQIPSAMEAVIWPQWSYTGTDDNSDNVWTTIPQAWLTSFRESLTTKIPRATIVGENTTTIVSSAAAEIDPNSNATTSANITMAARLLLAVDCCNGNGRHTNINCHSNDDTSNVLTKTHSLLPTINWTGPRLLKLPHLYDDVFQYYHSRPCHRCHGIPRETSVCLVCGTVVCLKENCCKTNGIFEAVQHSLECGGSTGMFLVVTSSSIIVIRGKRACLWGSVYLDAFGEEDRELKRGKPLYLSSERYRLLEHQWLAHRFDHTNKKWVWHRDAL